MRRVRGIVLVLAATLTAGATGATAASGAAKVPIGSDPVTLADPFLGTASGGPDFGTGGGAGNTYPGATLPFGLVQFSPDTFPDRDTLGAAMRTAIT